MSRRLPLGFVFAAALLAQAAVAQEGPVPAPIASVTLEGGAAYRNTKLLPDGQAQLRETSIQGISPWLLHLKADWYFLRWLGAEVELIGDFFSAQSAETGKLPRGAAGGLVRGGVALRYLSRGGFLLGGSLGYGGWWSPVIESTAAGVAPGTRASTGLTARVGLGYAGERFEAVGAGVLGLGLTGARHTLIEPQLWVGGRIIDIGPTALWVGVDASLLVEGSPSGVGYSGLSARASLAVRLTLLPPKEATHTVEPATTETTLEVAVSLPDGAPAVGALVSLDEGTPVAADAQGTLRSPLEPGAHAVKVVLAGHRPASVKAQAVEGQKTTVPVRLEALTGPGTLSGVVRASATGKPVADATVTVAGGAPVQTGEDGAYRVEKVGPGPVQVKVEAQGYNAADEVAQVPPEAAATLDVQLEPLGKGSPATVRGLVRSRTGEALTANVVIKGSNSTKVQVSPEGRFFVTVPGGTYLFVISAPGYVTQTKKVVLADGDQAILHTELQKVAK